MFLIQSLLLNCVKLADREGEKSINESGHNFDLAKLNLINSVLFMEGRLES